MQKRVLGFLSVCLLLATTIKAQNLPSGFKKGATVEGITEYNLPNGLKLLVFPDQSKPTITVNITYLVGSRSEGLGETGMAHLLEHMVFKGSPRHLNVPKELNDHGGNFNGTTWLDRTNYFEVFPATDSNLIWALDLESDRMINSFVAKKDLETEMTVVRNEFESGENDPSGVLMERVQSTAFLWHNYGKSTIGNRSDIENVPIENLQAFYRRFYQPDNAVLLVAGKIDEAKVLTLVNQFFGKIPKPTRQLPISYTVEPTQDGERSVTLKRVGDVQAVSAGYHIPPGSHPDYAGIEIITKILSNDPAGRIHKSLVVANKAAGQWGYAMGCKEPGFVYFNADVRKEQSLEEAKRIMMNTLDSIAYNAPTKEEVDRAKSILLKNLEQQFRNTERIGVGLSEYIALGDWRMGFLYRDAIKNTQVADIQRIAKAYFKPSNRTVGMFIPDANPQRAEIPNAPDVMAMVSDYKGDKPIAEGEVFDPSPANIEMRTHKGKETSGIDYAFLPKTTRGGSVNANITLRFGDEKSLHNQAINARMVANMLQKGTTTKTEQQIKDAFDQLKANVRVSGGGNAVNISIETNKENLPATIALVTDMLKNANLPAKEFEQMRQEELAGIEQQKNDPQAIANLELERILHPYKKGDINYTMTFEEEMEAIKSAKIEDAKKFYKDFYGASNTTVAIVGEFDEAAVKAAVTAGLSSWKSPKSFKRIDNKYMDIAKSDKKIQTPDKANAMFMAGMNINMRDDDPNFIPLFVGNYILGGGALSSRLADRIRQKEGLSYGVGSWVNIGPQDNAGGFGAYAIYAPENADKLEKAFKEEIDKLLKDGVTEKELQDAVKGLLQTRAVSRAQDGGLCGRLNRYLYINRDMKFDAAFDARLQTLTVDQVNTAIRKYIDASKITIVKAGDFDKVKKP
jgi:zinc protease